MIEEGLIGNEISILAICDGTKAVPLTPAQDYKRLLNNDEGPNTGGMGAYSPIPSVSEDFVKQIMDEAVNPTLQTLIDRGIDYRGVLYAGIMNTASGPKILEYNVRFGDPEAQVVLPRMESSLFRLLREAAQGNIEHSPAFIDDVMVTVVCASEGYPEAPKAGKVIQGLNDARNQPGVEGVFCAGVSQNDRGQLITSGGRVITVTGKGATHEQARTNAYRSTDLITWKGMYKRGDIAKDIN